MTYGLVFYALHITDLTTTARYKWTLRLQAQLEVPPDPILSEQPAAEEQKASAADEDVDIINAPAAAPKDESAQPSSSGKTLDAPEAATPAPVKATAPAAELEQPSSRGRGNRGRRGGRGGRGRGRSKSKARARASGNSSPRAASEQDQADFADQLDSPSRVATESADPIGQSGQSEDKDVTISDTTDQQLASQPQKGIPLHKDKSDASQASEQLTSAKSRAPKEAASHASVADESKASPVHDAMAPAEEEAKASKADHQALAKASKADVPAFKAEKAEPAQQDDEEEAKAAKTDEPPAKRPRRSASNASQKAEGTKKAKAKGPQARRGVLQESDSYSESEDVDIGGEQLHHVLPCFRYSSAHGRWSAHIMQ